MKHGTLLPHASINYVVVIHEFCAPSSKANIISDTLVKTTIHLWPLIQVHCTMKEIHDNQFQGPPSVAPLINLHMFKTPVHDTAFAKVGDSIKLLTINILAINKSFWRNLIVASPNWRKNDGLRWGVMLYPPQPLSTHHLHVTSFPKSAFFPELHVPYAQYGLGHGSIPKRSTMLSCVVITTGWPSWMLAS